MKGKKAELPKGFKPISGGSLGKSWEFKKDRVLEGRIESFGAVDSKFKKGEKQRNATIVTKSGEKYTVWESAGTRSLFDCKKGARVALAYLGPKKIKGRKEPMHDFAVGVA